MRIKILTLTILAVVLTACGSGSTGANKASEPQPMPFGALATEFKQSKEATRDKYKGKTLIVKGYTSTPPLMPTGASDAGILSLNEKGGDMLYLLSCQFTGAEKAEFSK